MQVLLPQPTLHSQIQKNHLEPSGFMQVTVRFYFC